MARARRVEVELGDGAADDDLHDEHDDLDGDVPRTDAPRRADRRWWWLAVPVVVVVALVLAQVVTDARERTGLADLAQLPFVVDPVDGPVEPAWEVPQGVVLATAARSGAVLVAPRTTDDHAVVLEGLDVATGAGLWSTEVVAARPDLGEDAWPDPAVCATMPDDERQVACLVPDGVWAYDEDQGALATATTTRLLVVDAAEGTVRADREVPTWAQWLTPVGPDVLLVGAQDGELRAVRQDPRGGDTRWSVTHASPDGAMPLRILPVATLLDDETVAVDVGGGVAFLSAVDGADAGWTVPFAGEEDEVQVLLATTTMSTALGAALVSTGAGTTVAAPGRAVTLEGLLPQLLVDDGSVPGLVLTSTPRLTAWDAGAGARRWEAGEIADALDVTVLDGRVHVSGPTDLVTLDGATGEELWRFPRPSAEGWTVTDGRYLYTTARRGDRHAAPYDVVALHPADGTEVWRAPLPDRSWLRSTAGLLLAVSYGPNVDAYEEHHLVLHGRG